MQANIPYIDCLVTNLQKIVRQNVFSLQLGRVQLLDDSPKEAFRRLRTLPETRGRGPIEPGCK